MKKNVFGRQLKRDTNERKALFKSLMSALVLKERIKTTEEKARAIRGQVEKLVTKAKIKGEAARSILSAYLLPNALDKMIEEIVPRFKERPGGYTRIVKLGRRFGDNAMMVLMEWVEPSEFKVHKQSLSSISSKLKIAEAITEEKVKKKRETNVKTKLAVKAKSKTKKVRKEVKK